MFYRENRFAFTRVIPTCPSRRNASIYRDELVFESRVIRGVRCSRNRRGLPGESPDGELSRVILCGPFAGATGAFTRLAGRCGWRPTGGRERHRSRQSPVSGAASEGGLASPGPG